jgi:hypothetical protein
MKSTAVFVFALLALASFADISFADASAAAPKVAPKLTDVFKDVTFTQPKCYGREYSRAELRAHPKQTVEQIKAKLIKYSADPQVNSAGLKIEVRLKGEEGTNYHAEFSCFENAGQTMCAIECDGGSVTVAEFDQTKMTLNSNGFTVSGGCGDDGEGTSANASATKFLDAIKGGDDIFKLQALPQAYCQ